MKRKKDKYPGKFIYDEYGESETETTIHFVPELEERALKAARKRRLWAERPPAFPMPHVAHEFPLRRNEDGVAMFRVQKGGKA